MRLTRTMILKLLEAEPGRYILRDHDEGGIYRLKKANGDDVTLTKNGKVFPVHPRQDLIDRLVDANQLVREAAKYRLPEAPPRVPLRVPQGPE
jgi:hypothetical protein